MQETTNPNPDELLSSAAAAKLLGVKAATLTNWRWSQAVSIPFVRIGRSIRYRKSDLLDFIEANREAA